MTEPNNQSPTDTQNEESVGSLKYEIADLKSHRKKGERIATLDVMLNQVMESHTAVFLHPQKIASALPFDRSIFKDSPPFISKGTYQIIKLEVWPNPNL